MVVTCEIAFDKNEHGTYYAGQLVMGVITLKSDKIKEVKAVTLKVHGFAVTSWSDKVFDDRRYYSGHEDYFSNLVYLLGSEESTKCTIPAGTHQYTFDFQLPYNCPTSVESINGQIRYMLKINLIRPWKFDQSFTKGFTVINFTDLNRESPLLRQPTHAEVQKNYGCGPCRSEPMNLEVRLQQSGFVPGQSIPITVTVTNDSHVPIVAIKIYLVMIITCASDPPIEQKTSERAVISKLKGEGVLRHCKKIFHYELNVPATPPTSTHYCRIIQVTYELNVEAYVKGLHASQVLAIPVTIGNVPFKEVIESQPRSLRKFSILNESVQSISSAASTSTENNFEREIRTHHKWVMKTFTALPPKYEPAEHAPKACLNANNKHDYGDATFEPYYPVFSLLSPSKIADSNTEQ